MALTYSKMLELNSKMPQFNLLNSANNKFFNSNLLSSKKTKLLMVICNHCPYVIHYHDIITKISQNYLNKIEIIAISSNDVKNYPQDSVQEMAKLSKKLNWNFPYLYDEDQQLAKNLQAQCTPEFYLFNNNNLLIYRGRMDETNPGSNKDPSGKDLINAIDCYLSNSSIVGNQLPSMGCSIKWL